jgi:Na+/phosphate symporter
MALVRGDLLVLAIVLIAIAIFIFVFPLPYPVIYIGYIAIIGGACVFVYWIYKQATQGS